MDAGFFYRVTAFKGRTLSRKVAYGQRAADYTDMAKAFIANYGAKGMTACIG